MREIISKNGEKMRIGLKTENIEFMHEDRWIDQIWDILNYCYRNNSSSIYNILFNVIIRSSKIFRGEHVIFGLCGGVSDIYAEKEGELNMKKRNKIKRYIKNNPLIILLMIMITIIMYFWLKGIGFLK